MFAEYIMTSGLCLNPEIKWVTFNGAVDFAYLLRSLLGSELPNDEISFLDHLDSFFGDYYDIKEMKREIEFLNGGLNKVSKELGIDRIGTTHQAGSDSLVTCGVFFSMVQTLGKFWEQLGIQDPIHYYKKKIYGLGNSPNEDRYLDEYRSYVIEYSCGNGKLLNLNKLNTNNLFSSSLAELTSNTSTTISASSSLNSLNSYNGATPQSTMVNQQHYLLL